MAEGVNVSQDAAAFRASVDRLQNSEMNRAVAIALNRTGEGVRAEAMRMIRATHKVGATELRKAFTIRKAYAGMLQTTVFASGRPLNLIAFGARQTRKGVTVDVKGRRVLVPHAFIASIGNNGFRGVFRRGRSSKEWYPGAPRFPIKALSSVSIPGLFRRDIASNALANVATDRFRRELAAAVRSIILRRG